MNKNTKILFFYQSGRKDKLKSQEPYAEEMFYGYQYFKNKKYNVEIIEFSEYKKILNKIYYFVFERNFRNIIKLPVYWSFLTNNKNVNKLISSDYAVFSNNRVGFAALPIITIAKLLRKKPLTLCFVMGLFSRKPKYKILRPIQKILLIYFLKNFDKLIFLSKSEYEYASINFEKYKSNFHILPFAVDLKIWKKNVNLEKKKQILFVGNDGFRDYNFAKQLANQLTEHKFVFVTQQIDKKDVLYNSNIYPGSWAQNSLSDNELASLYNESYITIVPLKNSLQPSGQSVTLQSIACGTPVLISKTDGFWDSENFKNKENLVLIDKNNIENWKDEISNLLENKGLHKKIQENGIKLIKELYDLESFSNKIEEILGISDD